MRMNLCLKFLLGCSVTLVVTMTLAFFVLDRHQENLLLQQAEKEAKAIYQQLVIMRSWIADHGGVFVLKQPWNEDSSFAEGYALIDDLGREYGLKTPAMVTKELSRISPDRGMYSFNITGTRLMNPANAPDELEREAMRTFERDNAQEHISIIKKDGSAGLRYIAPLYTEETCLPCHGVNGHRVGEVHGAISVTLPLSPTLLKADQNKRVMVVVMLGILFALCGVLLILLRVLVLRPVQRLSLSISDFAAGRDNSCAIPMSNDELEELCRSFECMSSRIMQYHSELQASIRSATEELVEANANLQHANLRLNTLNEKKSDFITRASHELRTPLTSIKGSMEYLSAKIARISASSGADHECSHLLNFCALVQKNTDRLIRMVNTMLDLERIDLDPDALLACTEFDLCQLVRDVAVETTLSRDKNIRIVTEIPEKTSVKADRDRIRQVLDNLLANALKVAPKHSTVALAVRRDEKHAVVELTDEGPGIPVALRERIFEKFYRLNRTDGTGLGLAFCRSVIQAHGGSIVAMDPLTDKGARFVFTLPLVAGRRRNAPAPLPPGSAP